MREISMRQCLGGKWRLCALIEFGLSGFKYCHSGAEWRNCFVAFMVHVEDRALQHEAVACRLLHDVELEVRQATHERAVALSAHSERGADWQAQDDDAIVDTLGLENDCDEQ